MIGFYYGRKVSNITLQLFSHFVYLKLAKENSGWKTERKTSVQVLATIINYMSKVS